LVHPIAALVSHSAPVCNNTETQERNLVLICQRKNTCRSEHCQLECTSSLYTVIFQLNLTNLQKIFLQYCQLRKEPVNSREVKEKGNCDFDGTVVRNDEKIRQKGTMI
jgi:hypothetical protein